MENYVERPKDSPINEKAGVQIVSKIVAIHKMHCSDVVVVFLQLTSAAAEAM